jgi:ring-1,2-phenylacetyl-CoA epoxidase subunit PaaC
MSDGHHTPDNAYGGLVEAEADSRWAFGGGFTDPLAGVDVSVPAGVDGPALAAYCLALGDDALVLAQRMAQWCTRAPELEEEVALANVGLDLVGQTRLLYARAAAADPSVVPRLPAGSPVPAEDRLAFFRDAAAFGCTRLALLPNGDFATTVVRLTAFATWRLAQLEGLLASTDPVLAAVAGSAVHELRYHRDYAVRWLLTLAGGTEESRRRTVAAVDEVWPAVAELERGEVDPRLVSAGVAPDPATLWSPTRDRLGAVLAAADLTVPEPAPGAPRGDLEPLLVPLLAELQGVARAHPEGRW